MLRDHLRTPTLLNEQRRILQTSDDDHEAEKPPKIEQTVRRKGQRENRDERKQQAVSKRDAHFTKRGRLALTEMHAYRHAREREEPDARGEQREVAQREPE